MPADYRSTAEGLSVSPSRNSPSPNSSHHSRTSSTASNPSNEAPPWPRRESASLPRLSQQAAHAGRYHHRRSASSFGGAGGGARAVNGATSFARKMWDQTNAFGEQVLRVYHRLTPVQKVLAVAVCVLGWVLLILSLVYSHDFFTWLSPVTKSWREKSWGWLIPFALVFFTAFPPLIGYSTACTITGFVYGFPLGWPIVAAACTLGSLAAFVASRTVLSGYVDRMVGKDHRFRALGQVLRREGLLYLTAIRFCPLPFSLSNGFLATIPSITPFSFALSTFLSSPKLLVHIFIGSRIAKLAESGDSMSLRDKVVNWISMIIFGAIGLIVGLVIYRRTMARAAQIAREEGDVEALTAAEEGQGAYEDHEDSTLMDPEDAAALMSDDDLSMWETQVDDATYSDGDGSDGLDGKKGKHSTGSD